MKAKYFKKYSRFLGWNKRHSFCYGRIELSDDDILELGFSIGSGRCQKFAFKTKVAVKDCKQIAHKIEEENGYLLQSISYNGLDIMDWEDLY